MRRSPACSLLSYVLIGDSLSFLAFVQRESVRVLAPTIYSRKGNTMKVLKQLLITLTGLVLTLSAGAVKAAHPAKIHYIDVGQAESILVELDKSAVLIDAGGETTNDTQQANHLIDYLKHFFQVDRTDLKNTIDTIIISHPHIDHTKNLMDVMQTVTVNNLIDGGENSGSGIAPLHDARNGGANGCANANNDSVVVLMIYKTKRFIFTGDAEDQGDSGCPSGEIEDLISRYAANNGLRVDVYKVDHHGSANGTDANWIKALSPQIAVISAGKIDAAHQVPGSFHAFQFGHPRESTVEILEQFTSGTRPSKTVTTMDGVKKPHPGKVINKAIYCTCWDGDIVIDGTTLSVKTSH